MNDIAHSNGPGMAGAFRDMYTGTQHTLSSEKTCTQTGTLMLGLIEDRMAL